MLPVCVSGRDIHTCGCGSGRDLHTCGCGGGRDLHTCESGGERDLHTCESGGGRDILTYGCGGGSGGGSGRKYGGGFYKLTRSAIASVSRKTSTVVVESVRIVQTLGVEGAVGTAGIWRTTA